MFAESSPIYKALSRAWHKVPSTIRLPLWQLYKSGDYQKIRFRGKTYVNGTDRSRSYRQLFPDPPVGKSILDVGCNLGFYSLMALREGAKYCRAIDGDPVCTDKLCQVAADLGLENIDVVNSNVFEYVVNEDFDLVLCLNVIHHFGSIDRVQAILDMLYQHVREKMMLIVLAPDNLTIPFTRDKEPNEPGGKRFIRISPCYFVDKYGADHVQVMPAVTYGPDRYSIVVTKPKPTEGI